MNFKELQDEVISTRFDDSDRDRIKRWLNTRYQWIWDQADWNFKHVPVTDLTIPGGTSTPTMPTDLARVATLYDDQGTPLSYIEPNDWDEYSLPIGQSATSGRAALYTVINRQLYLYPTPGAATYKISYRRRLSHVDPAFGVVGGILSDDTDQPLWPAEHDYVLVLEAVMLGQQLRNDPTWTMLVSQRDELLDAMKRDLIIERGDQTEQWGGC